MVEYPSELKQLLAILEADQAVNVVVIDVREQTSVTDYMIIAGGRSSRQIKAMANHTIEKMKPTHFPALGNHGLEGGDWALVDFGDYVLHIMAPETRAFYNLEGLWQDHSPS